MVYQNFSKIYDEFMDHSLYRKWSEYVRRDIKVKDSILELGCGAGHLAILLENDGFDVTGLDVSNEMLTLARENQLKQNTHFPLIQRDMKDLSEIGKFATVISFNDSICYLKNEKELQKVFEEVYSVLKESGTFIFDVHSILQMENYTNFSYHDEKDNTVLIWDSYKGEYEYSVEHDLSFFIQTDNDVYIREDETHKERTYPITTYKTLLEDTGFKDIQITGDFKDILEPTALRWFFKAVKRGK